MNTPSIKDKLTIVIPSKNEGVNIYECIGFISKQKEIQGTKIIIADISDEDKSLQWIYQTQIDFKYSLNIQIIKGGYPSEGRLKGSLLVDTPYTLFLDADVMLLNPSIIPSILDEEYDLLTVPFQTETGWNWVYRMFNKFQWISKVLGTPFAVGGFQLWNTESYWKVGGYNPMEQFAEDYSLSQKVDKKRFKVYNTKYVYTSARRFKNKGVLWMFKIMIMSYLNRKNPEFFMKSHGYWK
jgi:glycosyltransferase involved in cell wall biosynthesis